MIVVKLLYINYKYSKSKIIIFNKSGKILRDYNFVHKNRKIEIVQSFCYLGIDTSASGSFSHVRIKA